VLIVSNAVMGIALVVFAFSVSWPLSLATMVFVGMGRIGNNTSGATILQMQAEPEYLGRVMSVMMMNFGLSGLGTFLAGVMAQSISAQWSIGILAAALVAISIGSFVFMPRLRKLD
jgi:MFS family permease